MSRSILVCALVVVAACSTDPIATPAPAPVAITPPPAAIAPPAPPPTLVEFGAFDSARTRDPFEPGIAAAPQPIADDGSVTRKAKRFTLDDLKLVAIVGADGTARAMLVDPRGKGWVVTRGDHVGKPEITDHILAWRVDRVRETDVVFVREDSARPDHDSEKRVIALRTADAPIALIDD